MRSGFRLGLRHLVVFVTVAVVLNAQFTWWVVYSLRENQQRLDLERSLVVARAEEAALKLQLRAEAAARHIMMLPPGVIPAAAAPFAEVEIVEGGATELGWVSERGRQAFAWPLGRGRRLLAVLDARAPQDWLAAIDPSLTLVERGPRVDDEPRVAIGAPFSEWAIAPDATRWEEQLARYRRRVAIEVGEGVFFVAAMASAVAMLWRVLRREGFRERQHENFVSAVTHELKTPIAGIRLALETVLTGRVDSDGATRFLRNALADAERLSDLVEKVLEVTRYAGGAHRLRIELGDLSQIVEEEIAAAERRAVARGIELTADVTPGVQTAFDAEAIGIVLSNLLENALKYAQGVPPRVALSLKLEHGEAVLEVTDNGVGIAEQELESIFAPFYRSGDEVTRRTPGTGIGLFVAREIVVAHGGRLTASSPGRGQGSTFRLILPGASVVAEDEFSE